jgi:hypothetical protein
LTPKEASITVGAFDDGPSDLVPTSEYWIKRREPWLAALPGAQQAYEDPL